MPKWITMLEPDHWLQTAVYSAAQDFAASIGQMKDVVQRGPAHPMRISEGVQDSLHAVGHRPGDPGTGACSRIFFIRCWAEPRPEICDEASLMPCIISLAKAKREYEKIRSAIEQVEATGYGIVMPTPSTSCIWRSRRSCARRALRRRLKASAPSIHLLKATIITEISPIVVPSANQKNWS